jgi:hypothetical protein
MELFVLEFELNPELVNDWVGWLNGPEGLQLSKEAPGFVSAEWSITVADDGCVRWHLWEKWHSKTYYEQYIALPERQPGSSFLQVFEAVAVSEPRELWGAVENV